MRVEEVNVIDEQEKMAVVLGHPSHSNRHSSIVVDSRSVRRSPILNEADLADMSWSRKLLHNQTIIELWLAAAGILSVATVQLYALGIAAFNYLTAALLAAWTPLAVCYVIAKITEPEPQQNFSLPFFWETRKTRRNEGI